MPQKMFCFLGPLIMQLKSTFLLPNEVANGKGMLFRCARRGGGQGGGVSRKVLIDESSKVLGKDFNAHLDHS